LRIDQQHHTIDHGQRTLHFATEVGVTRGVNDVDVCAFPAHGTVLGQNGDAAFTFDGIVVHHSIDDFFVFGEGTSSGAASWSTMVVLPWSTWAMIAILRI
jgi:hypothetical protein